MAGKKKSDFITLKEAAEISGYTPDYLGQLIRKGKLEGEQVFMNVAWMTTREAVEDYLSTAKKSKESTDKTFKEKMFQYANEHWPQYAKGFIYTLIGFNIVFLFFLLHLLSFSIEKHLESMNVPTVHNALQQESL